MLGLGLTARIFGLGLAVRGPVLGLELETLAVLCDVGCCSMVV